MRAESDTTETGGIVIPYRAWWGLMACVGFMGLIGVLAPYSAHIDFVPDEPGFVYYWVLPDPSSWTRFAAWTGYALHQLAIWFLIYHARKIKPRYARGLHPVNVWALGVNGFFIALHIFQTKLTYDGLAQDVHEATALGSVVIMLLLILIMENGRRGLFFSKPVRALNGVGAVVRRYHGYYISWAITYTFWYHPIEITSGHLIGTFYMFMLFLQGSLFYTRFHVNRWWTVTLETFFVFHGAVVAYFIMQEGGGHWSQFLFGGFAIFLITQLYGLSLSRRQILATSAMMLGAMAVYYAFNPDAFWGIPRHIVMRYASTFILAGLLWLMMRPFVITRRGAAPN